VSNGTYTGYTWRWYDEHLPDEPKHNVHECVFPDTGMKRSWCKYCGDLAEFNMQTGTYRRVDEKSSTSSSESK
jgi:hypothetical protein